jgi:hypothetical protein
MKDVRTEIAMTLAPLMDGFHAVSGQILRAVWRTIVEGSVEKVVLDFDQLSLVIEADPDTDTVRLRADNKANSHGGHCINTSASETWGSVVGRSFGWGWITMNQQGYCDGVLLSFDGITPQIMLAVVASSLKESKIESLS